jgi:hypothetical protein
LTIRDCFRVVGFDVSDRRRANLPSIAHSMLVETAVVNVSRRVRAIADIYPVRLTVTDWPSPALLAMRIVGLFDPDEV